MTNHPLVRLGRLTFEKYQRDNVGGLAAALAYFMIFSIFPLILVTLSIVGFVVDPARFDVEEQLLELIGSPDIRELVAQTLAHFASTRVGAGLVGFAILAFSATGIFGALNRTFMVIWESEAKNEGGNLKTTVLRLVLARLTAFSMLIGIAGLILAALIANLALALISAYTDWLPFNTVALVLLQRLVTLSLITVAFATLYKVLPGPDTATWRDVWAGAIVAALGFVLLQQLAEFIFAQMNFSSFGVLGGGMAFLMWIFIANQILLIGAEISYAWAHVFGSRKAA
ncbi:MAG: YihY/virulence factor BrkB family protein [Candidatus Viridilinea halotolerans]|uniref:YihY/virulence factor BrkB family protein n=1 Tax=Candidatus Viridilinea halotolerans TaxID=2491704 RepID=A0A426UAF3_9CHLR|nr:MAG: YihY/virulence factor BrkB family protein [Candidatus Viridilinea halotolerans]